MSEETQTETSAESTQGQEAISPEAFKKLQDRAQRLEGALKSKEDEYKKVVSVYKDIDPDEARQLKSRLEEAERKAAEKDPAKMEELFERKVKKIQSELQGERDTLAKELELHKKELKTLKVTDKVMSEIGHLFNKDAIKYVKREVEERCDIDEDGTIIVKDQDGQPLFKGGKYLGPQDFGEMLVEECPSFAAPRGSGGSKDMTSGTKVGKHTGRDPQTYAEFQAMGPAGKEWFENAKKTPEGQAKLQKILGTM